MRLDSDDLPCLSLNDKNGKSRITLDLETDGSPRLRLYDRSEDIKVNLLLSSDGGPQLLLSYEGVGDVALMLGVREGCPFLGYFDRDGNPRLAVGITDSGAPLLTAYDKNGHPEPVVWGK